MYRILQGLHENALMEHLIKTYDWNEVEQICNHHPYLIKSILRNSNTPLHEMCLIGSTPHDLLRKVVNSWPEAATTRNRWGETPLHARCRCSQYSLYPVQLLVNTNPSALKMVNDTGKTPLAIACVNGASVSVVRELVAAYPEALCMKDINDNTPIDLLWSSFAKTIPGAFAITNYLKQKPANETVEMSGILSRFYEKMSFCLVQSRGLSKKSANILVSGKNNQESNVLLAHTIIEQSLRHSPHSLLEIFLTQDRGLGLHTDENGNTPLHLQFLTDEIDLDCIRVILSKCQESAAMLNIK